MARTLILGLIAILGLFPAAPLRAQSSAPDVEVALFGGPAAASDFRFTDFGLRPDARGGGVLGAQVLLKTARQALPGWTTYLGLTAGSLQQTYATHSPLAGGAAVASGGSATQAFMAATLDLRRDLDRRARVGVQLGAGLMDLDVLGGFDANAKMLFAMVGVYGAYRLAPRVTAGPYALVLAPFGRGTVKRRGGGMGDFHAGPTVMVGFRVSFGL